MISTVEVKVGKTVHKLKLSVRAQYRLEEATDRPIGDLMMDLHTGKGGVRLVSQCLAEALDDGAGGTLDDALALLEACGGAQRFSPHLSDVLNAAFPVPEEVQGDKDPEADDASEGNQSAA
ncbi:MAG: hypothetical protein MRY77_05660 [Rhodobacteraceae bacterium]|nr:hypothetical protein [Paracoccaceae bacterium]